MFSLAMAHKALVGGDIADAALRARFEKNLQAFLSLAEAAKHYPCIKRAWVEFLGEPPGAGGGSRRRRRASHRSSMRRDRS